MRYDDPRLLDRLAREYVLGTLTGAARRRFEGVRRGNLAARRAVREWEERLVPLAIELPPIEPPARVWPAVRGRLGFAAPSRTWLWPSLAAVLAALAVTLGVLNLTREPRLLPPDITAIVADEQRTPVWLVQVSADAHSLRVHAVGAAQAPQGRDYELWMLPDDGSAPVSLGLLPGAGIVDVVLSPERLAVLSATSTLAVSLEPTGGSPSGAPTGPVVFTAPLVRT